MPNKLTTNAQEPGAVVLSGVVEALTAATERLLRSGPSVDDVASALALAQLFPGVFSAVYDRRGRYRWVSHSLASMMGPHGPGLVGRTIDELFEFSWCEERLALIRGVMDHGSPAAAVEVFRGRRLESAVIPVLGTANDAVVVFIGRFGLYLPNNQTADEQKVSTVTRVLLETADWGPLSVLTRRELEVLRLIALGLDNPGIAKSIHRTKRAVEWHIQNLYQHLGCESRADLFRYGLFAGLQDIDDAHWESMMTHVKTANHSES